MAEHDRPCHLALGAALAGPAPSQRPASTQHRIKSIDEVRVGNVPGEPWFCKDLVTGTWRGRN